MQCFWIPNAWLGYFCDVLVNPLLKIKWIVLLCSFWVLFETQNLQTNVSIIENGPLQGAGCNQHIPQLLNSNPNHQSLRQECAIKSASGMPVECELWSQWLTSPPSNIQSKNAKGNQLRVVILYLWVQTILREVLIVCGLETSYQCGGNIHHYYMRLGWPSCHGSLLAPLLLQKPHSSLFVMTEKGGGHRGQDWARISKVNVTRGLPAAWLKFRKVHTEFFCCFPTKASLWHDKILILWHFMEQKGKQ